MPALSHRARIFRDILNDAFELQEAHLRSLQERRSPARQLRADDESTSHSETETHASSDSLSLRRRASDSEEELFVSNMAAIEEFLATISAIRVLEPSAGVAKSPQLPLVLDSFYAGDPKRFQRNMRCSPAIFDHIVALLETDAVFENRSNQPQLPVRWQVAIALYRFGHFGNAVSVEGIAQWAGVSAGMVYKATVRVILAILGLHDQFIRWPTDEEKDEAMELVSDMTCPTWRGGFCMVDGTLVKLYEKPGWHGEAFFSRKSTYALNVQIVNLPNRIIIDYGLGHTGSAHDSTAFADSRVAKEHATLLEPGEWVWADSAYAVHDWCIAPYKGNAAKVADNRTFNFHLSKIRVRSEHTMGMLKGRFSSLKELRQQINSERAHRLALAWIRACIILHNVITLAAGESEDRDFVEELLRLGRDDDGGDDDAELHVDVVLAPGQRLSPGQLKREQLKAALLRSLG